MGGRISTHASCPQLKSNIVSYNAAPRRLEISRKGIWGFSGREEIRKLVVLYNGASPPVLFSQVPYALLSFLIFFEKKIEGGLFESWVEKSVLQNGKCVDLNSPC